MTSDFDEALTPRHEAPAGSGERWACNECGFVGVEGGNSMEVDCCSSCGENSPGTGPDKCSHCGDEGTMCSACPKCGGRYSYDPDESHEAPAEGAGEALTVDGAWEELLEKDDRTSPEGQPEMLLITHDELEDFMVRARSSAPEAREGDLPVAWASEWHGHGGLSWALHSAEDEAIANAKWMSGRSFPLYAHPAASADKLREFGQHTNLELSYGHGDEVEDGAWQVHRVNGGVNDREWALIGSGETPADAIDQALAALKAEGK